VRVVWIVLYTSDAGGRQVQELFDALPNILMCFLASTITLLWYEIYLSSSLLISPQSKYHRFLLSIIFFIVVNITSITFTFLILFDSGGSWDSLNNKFKNFTILDSVTNVLNSTGMIFSGVLLSKNAKLVFYGRVGEMVSRRINSISVFASIMFIGKTVVLLVSLAYQSLLGEQRSDIE
jgi:hypothetical protein